MLTIAADTLPRTDLSYLAFRISFQETLERIMLTQQMGSGEVDGFGYLTEVPFLQAVPPHVQLDALANTWSKHVSPQTLAADLVDESVVYAVCETAAQVVETEPEEVPRYLMGGPREINVEFDHPLASQLRSLHLDLSNEGDFLMVSQFEDMRPDESRWMKRKFNLDPAKQDAMFELLGRWSMSPRFARNLDALLTPQEISRAVELLGAAVQNRVL